MKNGKDTTIGFVRVFTRTIFKMSFLSLTLKRKDTHTSMMIVHSKHFTMMMGNSSNLIFSFLVPYRLNRLLLL